jgi:hypothetical protein
MFSMHLLCAISLFVCYLGFFFFFTIKTMKLTCKLCKVWNVSFAITINCCFSSFKVHKHHEIEKKRSVAILLCPWKYFNERTSTKWTSRKVGNKRMTHLNSNLLKTLYFFSLQKVMKCYSLWNHLGIGYY